MSRSDVDAWLDECDDVLTDWAGSVDSATWAADGSHETDISGWSYYEDARADERAWVLPEVVRYRLAMDINWIADVNAAVDQIAAAFSGMIEVGPRPHLVVDGITGQVIHDLRDFAELFGEPVGHPVDHVDDATLRQVAGYPLPCAVIDRPDPWTPPPALAPPGPDRRRFR